MKWPLRIGVGAALVLAVACATNPATGERQVSLVSEDQEIAIGQEQDGQIRKEMGVYDDQNLQKYVSDIGMKLAKTSERPNLPWHFTVVDAPAINAFALPGGYIYITRGILPFLGDESQLAGVLGHEIGHVTARHSSEQYSRALGAQAGLVLSSIFIPATRPFTQLGSTALSVLFLKYGRDDEVQADALGVRYESRAGWNPEGVPQMLTTLGRIEEQSDSKGTPNWLLTHPPADDRVERVQVAVRDAQAAAPKVVTNREQLLSRVDGLVFGDNPQQGVVRGTTFLHPALRFAIDFPQGWPIQNGQAQVVAQEPNAGFPIVLQLLAKPEGTNIQDIAIRSMTSIGFTAVDGSRTRINGLDAFVGTYRGTLEDGTPVAARVGHVVHDNSVFVIAGLASPQGYQQVDPVFIRSIQSFRSISRGEADAIRPSRVTLYTARAGDTWQAIAERQRGVVKPTTLAIMNGRGVNDQPRAGERIKIVVAG